MQKAQKLGLDIDGVITDSPEFFSLVSSMYLVQGFEVHIITGNKQTPKLEDMLRSLGIQWTHFFSISDFHHEAGTPMTGYEENRPRIEPAIWDRAKGIYCRDNQIDLHIDDSDVYGLYFFTPYRRWIGVEAA